LELRKPKGDAKVKAWFETVRAEEVFLSVLVVREIRQGVERLAPRDPEQARVYAAWLEALKRDYREHLLPIDSAVAETWGRLNAANPLPVVDGLLAATALVHELALVTRNVADVAQTRVAVLNPFG
jgi:toxin FitB